MANKRMFTMSIVDSDAFLDMPSSTQCLYFHLNMRADDDGFISNPKKILRIVGGSEDDLKLLFLKRFILSFDSGVIVIKHWRMHNTLQKDRYNPTVYQEEYHQLSVKTNKSYTLKKDNEIDTDNKMLTECIQSDNTDLGLDLGLDKGLDIDLEKTKERPNGPGVSFTSVINNFTQNEELRQSLTDYKDMRLKKKGFTPHALKLLLKRLSKLSDDPIVQLATVNQSIERTWMTFYPYENLRELEMSGLTKEHEEDLRRESEFDSSSEEEKEDAIKELRARIMEKLE